MNRNERETIALLLKCWREGVPAADGITVDDPRQVEVLESLVRFKILERVPNYTNTPRYRVNRHIR